MKLPELDELYQDIRDSVPEIDRIYTTYGNSSRAYIEIFYGDHHQRITHEDACLIVRKVRDLFMQEEFQKTFLAEVRGVDRDDILQGG